MQLPVPKNKKTSNFSSDILTLVAGTTIAQFITILASPIITRLYGPETFGLLAIFSSITSIIGVVACMRYELAIMLPESDKDAANVFGLSIIFVIIVSIVSVFFLILFQQPLLLFLKAPQLSPFIWLIPLTIMASGIFLALNYWNTRTKHFHRLSIARVISSCSSTGTQLGMGFLGHASGGALIGASILGQIVSTLVLGIQIMRDHFSFFTQNISWNGIIDVLKRYSNFPKYDIWSALMNTISWQIPIFLLSYFFSTTVVGYYSLGMMLIQLPMSFVGNAIAQVFFQRASEVKQGNILAILVENVFKVLIVIGLFPILILTIIGEDLFSVVFGSIWAEAGIYTQILSIWALVWFISSPLSTLYITLEKQEFGLLINSANFITRLLSLCIGGWLGSIYIALLLFAISGIFVNGFLCLNLLKFSNVNRKNIKKIIFANGILFLPAGIVILTLKLLNINSIFLVCLSGLILTFYYGYIISTDNQIKNLVDMIIKRKSC